MDNKDMVTAQPTNEAAHSESDSGKIALALAALVGALGIAVSGGNVATLGADALPQLAAIAVPGVMAWILSYLLSQKTARSYESEFPVVENVTSEHPGFDLGITEDKPVVATASGFISTRLLPLPTGA